MVNMKELQKEEVKWRYQVIDHGSAGSPDLRVHELYFNNKSGCFSYGGSCHIARL